MGLLKHNCLFGLLRRASTPSLAMDPGDENELWVSTGDGSVRFTQSNQCNFKMEYDPANMGTVPLLFKLRWLL